MPHVQQKPVAAHPDPVADENVRTARLTGGQLTGLDCSNINSVDLFVQFFDAVEDDIILGGASADNARVTFVSIPAGDGTKRGGRDWEPKGGPLPVINALSYAVTTTATGSTGPTTPVELTVFHR